MNFKIFFYLGAWRSLANREFVARNITDIGICRKDSSINFFYQALWKCQGFVVLEWKLLLEKSAIYMYTGQKIVFVCEKDSKMDQSNICHMFTGMFCFWLIQFVSGFADAMYVLDDKYSSTVTPVWLQRGRKIIYEVTTSPQTPRNLFFGMW